MPYGSIGITPVWYVLLYELYGHAVQQQDEGSDVASDS